ncbi:MAG: Mbeg1-like protein [Planctomycetia bacterium]
MTQAQAGADFGIASAIAGATAGKAGAAAGTIYSAAVSKAAVDLTRALNAVQTGFVDAATAASVKATKAIAAAETVERKAVAKADVVLAQDLQSAWGTYAAAERSAVTLDARERATIGADSKKDVAGAELAAVKAVAPARKTSMVATAEANGVYEVKVTEIISEMGILAGTIHVSAVKAKIADKGRGFNELHVPYAAQFGDGDFQANLNRSKDGTYYLAFRGTEGPNLADWRCNAEQGLGGLAGQYEQAARLAASVGMALAPNQRLILTGHSLGGGLASYAALHNGLEAIVFNPASVHSSVADNARAKIRSHLVFGDPLSLGRTLTNPFQWTVPQDLISRATLGPILSLRCPRGDVILHDFKGWLIIDGHGFGSFPGVR